LAIVVGGGIAGTLDLLQACILFGWDIPLVIAGGLLGRGAFQGGAGTYVLGIALHFFIACSAAAVYYVASRWLGFLREHPLVCGLFFWRRGGRCDAFCRSTPFRASFQGPIQTKRLDSRADCAHGRGRAPHFHQRSAVCKIESRPLSCKTFQEG